MECSVQYEITRVCVVTHSDNKSRSYGFMNRYSGILNPESGNPESNGNGNPESSLHLSRKCMYSCTDSGTECTLICRIEVCWC